MKDAEKVKFVEYLSMSEELKALSGKGTYLMLEGRSADAEKIAAACVFGDGGDYMRDYIYGRGREIEALNFNIVRYV